MKKPYKLALFIFRRDLRIDDNTGLRSAFESSELVLPCFIIDPKQVGAGNQFRSLHALQFMKESLAELYVSFEKRGGKLYLFHGTVAQVLKKVIAKVPLEAIFVNKDYTLYSTERDVAMLKIAS